MHFSYGYISRLYRGGLQLIAEAEKQGLAGDDQLKNA